MRVFSVNKFSLRPLGGEGDGRGGHCTFLPFHLSSFPPPISLFLSWSPSDMIQITLSFPSFSSSPPSSSSSAGSPMRNGNPHVVYFSLSFLLLLLAAAFHLPTFWAGKRISRRSFTASLFFYLLDLMCGADEDEDEGDEAGRSWSLDEICGAINSVTHPFSGSIAFN